MSFFQTSHLASVHDDETALHIGSRLDMIIDGNLRDSCMVVPLPGAIAGFPNPSPTTLVFPVHGARVRWRRTSLGQRPLERRATDSCIADTGSTALLYWSHILNRGRPFLRRRVLPGVFLRHRICLVFRAGEDSFEFDGESNRQIIRCPPVEGLCTVVPTAGVRT